MTDIHYISKKTDRKYLFEVQLNWLEDNLGVLEANDVNGQLHAALPEKFGGKGNEWSAEHLLLCSLASSFMATFLAYTKKMSFQIAHFECTVIGQIKAVNGRYKFIHIDVYPKVFIIDKLVKNKAVLALRKTEKNCLVTNSLNADIIYHSLVINDEKNLIRPSVVSSNILD